MAPSHFPVVFSNSRSSPKSHLRVPLSSYTNTNVMSLLQTIEYNQFIFSFIYKEGVFLRTFKVLYQLCQPGKFCTRLCTHLENADIGFFRPVIGNMCQVLHNVCHVLLSSVKQYQKNTSATESCVVSRRRCVQKSANW